MAADDSTDVFDNWTQGLGVSTQTFDQQDSSGDAPLQSGSSAAPTISVSANGDGSFVVTGSGFLANAAVHVRMVDEALHQLWGQTKSDGSGNISWATGGICAGARTVSFSANDGRQVPASQDITGVLWSNTVTLACPEPAPPDDPDDPDPAPDPAPSDPGSGDSSDD